MLGDTIAAIATGAAPGGIGVVRVSGPRAIEIVAAVIGRAAPELGREVVFGIARDAHGARLDEVVAFAMRAPRSFTGEDVAELQGHGGVANMARLLGSVLARGARAAEPGEFTRRAFDNGKLDLPKAEALLAVIEAGTERALRVGQEVLAGELSKALDGAEQRGLEVLAEVEGSIDFPEDDLVLARDGWVRDQCAELAQTCARWAATFAIGKVLRQGISVALTGPVNAGKSSLFNALCGSARALVSSQPGTTRDYVEARVEWEGVPITLVDTAGLRESEAVGDAIEQAGIALGQARAVTADVVLKVSDAPVTVGEPLASNELIVGSKADLGNQPSGDGVIWTSATTGRGLAELRQRILAVATAGALDGDDGVMLITERQKARALAASACFEAAAVGLAAGLALEMIALEIRQGVFALAEMRGREVTERVLDEVFARFCVGK